MKQVLAITLGLFLVLAMAPAWATPPSEVGWDVTEPTEGNSWRATNGWEYNKTGAVATRFALDFSLPGSVPGLQFENFRVNEWVGWNGVTNNITVGYRGTVPSGGTTLSAFKSNMLSQLSADGTAVFLRSTRKSSVAKTDYALWGMDWWFTPGYNGTSNDIYNNKVRFTWEDINAAGNVVAFGTAVYNGRDPGTQGSSPFTWSATTSGSNGRTYASTLEGAGVPGQPTPELGTWMLLACSGLIGIVPRLRRRRT